MNCSAFDQGPLRSFAYVISPVLCVRMCVYVHARDQMFHSSPRHNSSRKRKRTTSVGGTVKTTLERHSCHTFVERVMIHTLVIVYMYLECDIKDYYLAICADEVMKQIIVIYLLRKAKILFSFYVQSLKAVT